MRVVIKGKPVVTDVPGGIFRLCHGPNGKHLHHILLLLPLDGLQQGVHRLSHTFGGYRLNPITEFMNEIVEVVQFFGIWTVVNPIYKRPGGLCIVRLPTKFRHPPVGQ